MRQLRLSSLNIDPEVRVCPEPATKLGIFSDIYILLEALQDLMIIQRPLSPPPLEERPVGDLTVEEMRDLIRQQRVRNDSYIDETLCLIFGIMPLTYIYRPKLSSKPSINRG
jgi:hypothetical protein